MKDIYEAVAEDGLKGVFIIFMLCITYKIFRMKSASDSECGKDGGCFHFKSQTSNEGGHITITDEHVETAIDNLDNNNNV